MIVPADSCPVLLRRLQEIDCTNHRQSHVTRALPHTVHVNYEEFLLIALPLSLEI
jgi:hypothetical protein